MIFWRRHFVNIQLLKYNQQQWAIFFQVPAVCFEILLNTDYSLFFLGKFMSYFSPFVLGVIKKGLFSNISVVLAKIVGKISVTVRPLKTNDDFPKLLNREKWFGYGGSSAQHCSSTHLHLLNVLLHNFRFRAKSIATRKGQIRRVISWLVPLRNREIPSSVFQLWQYSCSCIHQPWKWTARCSWFSSSVDHRSDAE